MRHFVSIVSICFALALAALASATFLAPAAPLAAALNVPAPETDFPRFDLTAAPSLAAPSPKPARIVAKQRPRVWTCGAWQASQAGGAYKPCEWR